MFALLVIDNGIRNVFLMSNNDTTLLLKDVRNAPYIQLNLILARKLDDEGYANTFGDGQ